MEPGNAPKFYKFDHERVGVAFIVNQTKNRKGAKKDGKRIKKCLERYGFELVPGDDITFTGLNKTLQTLSARDYSKYSCFLMVIMAHGDGETIITSEGLTYDLADIYPPFYPTNCPTLAEKPKLFLIQACRGTGIDEGHEVQIKMQVDSIAKLTTRRIPITADILTMNASDERMVAIRDPKYGSWFIQTLCEELDKALSNNGIILFDLLLKVQRRIATEKYSVNNDVGRPTCQMPTISSTLTRHCFFAPKPQGKENMEIE